MGRSLLSYLTAAASDFVLLHHTSILNALFVGVPSEGLATRATWLRCFQVHGRAARDIDHPICNGGVSVKNIDRPLASAARANANASLYL
jgi:hypothetical protein